MDIQIWARLPLVVSIAIVTVTLHLVAKVRDDESLFFIDLGRPLTASDRARARRVLVVNALVSGVSIVIALTTEQVLLVTAVGVLAPLLIIGWLLVEMALVVRELPARKTTGRFLVPLEDPPGLRDLWSPPLWVAQLAVVLLASGAFWALKARLPARIPLHFNAAGQPDRWGSPNELWLFLGLMSLDLVLLVGIALGISKERWVLPPEEPDRYAVLALRRRQLIVRLVESLMLGLTASYAVLWLALTLGSLPGYGHLLGALVTVGVLAMALATILPLLLFLSPLLAVQRGLRALSGQVALGTRADGWRLGGFIYYSPEDPALLVPKQRGIGQTLNFARPLAWVLLVGVLALPVVITFISKSLTQ